MSDAQVLIVGAGINGLCTAWALVRRGFRVTVFDQGPITNPVSSSHDEHRVTRHAYGPMRAHAARMPGAFRLWDVLFADIGARHFDPVPVVAFERAPSGWIDPSLADLDRMGLPWRELDPAGMATTHPLLRSAGVTRAVELGGSGVLFASRILTDLVVHLAAQGVRFQPHCRVTDLDPETGCLSVEGTRHAGDHIVVAAGAWVRRLLPGADTLVPSRQVVAFLAPPPGLVPLWAEAPIYFDLDADIGTYALPPRPGTRLKIGDHRFSLTGDPDDSRLAGAAESDRLMDALRRGYAGFDSYLLLESRACYYTVTPDEDFVIRPLGAKATLVSACSGHGFKLAPDTAERAADLVAAAG
ncbi:MAG: FAD-dependent oxidoreductase [Mangrovicoccus sp.]|nr:FAD-dependent oxidoreductase [Mangrovicoccus sp.]